MKVFVDHINLSPAEIEQFRVEFQKQRGTSPEKQERKRQRFEAAIDDYIAENVSKGPNPTSGEAE